MMKPLPSLNQTYSLILYYLLLQEENQRSTLLSSVTDNLAMNVKFTGSKAKQSSTTHKKLNSVEETCHNTGHLQDKSFSCMAIQNGIACMEIQNLSS